MQIINIANAGVITQAKPVSQIGISVLSFLLSVVGIIAIIALVISAIMYLTAAGDQKQMQAAKTYVQYSILGIILAMSSYILILLAGQFFKK